MPLTIGAGARCNGQGEYSSIRTLPGGVQPLFPPRVPCLVDRACSRIAASHGGALRDDRRVNLPRQVVCTGGKQVESMGVETRGKSLWLHRHASHAAEGKGCGGQSPCGTGCPFLCGPYVTARCVPGAGRRGQFRGKFGGSTFRRGAIYSATGKKRVVGPSGRSLGA